MLVLSRRTEEKIVFPQQGITVHVLGVRGNVVRIGVEAPAEIKVLRDELAGPGATAPAAKRPAAAPTGPSRIDQLTRQLEKHWEAGRVREAEASLREISQIVAAAGRERAAKQESPKAQGAKPRTLLVEDNAREREMLASLLALKGIDCSTAEDGLVALDFLASHEKPDFVLLDMNMPRCDGPETVARIRRDPRLAGLKVFAVSGTAPRDLGLSTGPEGVDGWFPKPLDPMTFWDSIQTHLGATAAAN